VPAQFIEADLKNASQPANRRQQPWIIMWSHRPLYCSDGTTWEGRCISEATKYRANIEGLMSAAHVDLHLSGHNHQYERSWPVAGCDSGYKSGCDVQTPDTAPGITASLYKNPKHTVHIVNGAAGDIEGSDPTWVAQSKVHTAHCTLHTAHYTLHATHYSLHTTPHPKRTTLPRSPSAPPTIKICTPGMHG
jgi:hypothetical protein